MTEHDVTPGDEGKPASVNPGYPAFQIAKALTTAQRHADPATRVRAEQRVSKWATVLGNILNGAVAYGSRTPIEGVPGWATLEVVTGGFATGELLAGGPLQGHEQRLLEEISGVPGGEERRALNAYFLTEAGLAELRNRLHSGCYDVAVPEEGALMVVAWLVDKGYAEDARGLVDQLAPYFPRLRFYPIPREKPRHFGSRVHVQDVGATLRDLGKIEPNERILAQKEAVKVWRPLYDRIVALFLETVEDGWPCQKYPDDWPECALALLREYAALRKEHTYCGKMERAKEHSAQLREFLGRCARTPDGLSGREVGRIRLILNCYLAKRGSPASPTCVEARRRQLADVNAPTFHAIAGVVAARLEKHCKDDGLDDVGPLTGAITADEASSGVPQGTPVPPSIRRKVQRCLNESVHILVERGLITSAESLARCLPQMTSGIRSAGITEPSLRRLDAAIYRAFRRRRSLLLLNMEKQIQIEELPWVAAIGPFRNDSQSSRELARRTLEEVTVLTLTSFPHAILPNKLLQELRSLVTSAGLDIPLVDELAADIFMGKFSGKFVESAWRAADLLKGSLYAAYYGIDYEEVRSIPKPKEATKRAWSWAMATPKEFVHLCARRAGVSLGSWRPATNGMIIEQQQILTTQNLGALYAGLNLADALGGQLGAMAKQCFEWICKRQQVRVGKPHAKLKMLKNTAYAWRQMIFFLALLPSRDVSDFLRWAEEHLDAQQSDVRQRFAPVLRGLVLVANGTSIDQDPAKGLESRPFLGWSNTTHWLLADVQGE